MTRRKFISVRGMENKKANGTAVWVLLWCRVPPGGEESADRREAISSPDYRN